MIQYPTIPIRLQCNLASAPAIGLIDTNTGEPPQFFRGQPIALQIGLFDAYGNPVDVSNIAGIIVSIQAQPSSITVNASEVTSVVSQCTTLQWENGTNQNAIVNLTSLDTDLPLGFSPWMPYWMAVVGLTVTGGTLIYGAGWVTVYNPGNIPAAFVSAYVSAHVTLNSSGSFTVVPISQVHHEEIIVTGVSSTRQIVISAANLQDGAIVALRFELPMQSGIIFQIYDQSTAGTLLTTFQSDPSGFTPSARFQYYYNGINFNLDNQTVPASGQQT